MNYSVGQVFKPCDFRDPKKGIYPPAIVGRQKGRKNLGDGEKRLYHAIFNWANASGICWPSFLTLADSLGKCERTVRTEAEHLEALRLIKRNRENRRAPTVYSFLWHEMFERQTVTPQPGPEPDGVERQHVASQDERDREVDGQTVAAQSSSVDRQPDAVERQDSSSCAASLGVLCGNMLPPSISNIERSISSSNADAVESLGPNDDDPHSSQDEELNTADRESLIETARDQLRAAVASARGVPLNEQKRADREITIAILESFTNWDCFQDWIADTCDRRLASRCRDLGSVFALYARDAKNRATDIAEARIAEEKRRVDEQIAEERAREAQAAIALTMATPAAPEAAIAIVEREGRKVPDVLQKRLKRQGTMVSPNEVIHAEQAYRPCRTCVKGLVGTAIERTLEFCDCIAGEEARIEDPQFVERQIAEVHATTKSRLAAALSEVNGYGLADAIQDSKLEETADTIRVVYERRYRLFFSGSGDRAYISKALALIGDTRAFEAVQATEVAA